MRAHEAGALHGDLGTRGPAWLRTPEDVNALVPQLWPRTVTRAPSGELTVGGMSVRALAAEYGTPAYVLDEEDLRARCRDFAAAFAGADVYYAGKAFLCRAVVRIIAEEGLFLDVCTGGELAVALAAGFPAERMGFHGNNKSPSELSRALDAGVGRIIVDSFDEIARLTALAREKGRRPAVLVRVTVGVEAHTHEFIATAHEDQKFGFSLAGGAAAEAARQHPDAPVPLHLRNAPTSLMKEWGYGEGYMYAHNYEGAVVDLQCLPDEIKDERFYEPTDRGFEAEIARRMQERADNG